VSVVVVVGDQGQQGYGRRGRGTSVHRKLEPMLKRPPFGFRQVSCPGPFYAPGLSIDAGVWSVNGVQAYVCSQ
jgi:hypothetical protein